MPACELSQVDFLGCHVLNFSANLGIGNEESTVTISLVPTCDTSYTGQLGCLYTFTYANFSFTGLLSKHDRTVNASSGDTISITLSDGRRVLDNVAVILSRYYCPAVPQPNIINALAKLEPSVGCGPIGQAGCNDFMNSMSDENGMPIYFALQAINGETVVCPLCGVVLTIDISLVLSQATPMFLRIGENTLSVAEIVNRACDNAGHDLMWTIIGNTLTAIPIDRRTNPNAGEVLAFMNSVAPPSSVTDRKYGQTTSFEKSKKFVLGQNVHYFLEINNQTGCYQAIAGPDQGDSVDTDPTIDNPDIGDVGVGDGIDSNTPEEPVPEEPV